MKYFENNTKIQHSQYRESPACRVKQMIRVRFLGEVVRAVLVMA